MRMSRRCAPAMMLCVTMLQAPGVVIAQSGPGTQPNRMLETRASLESELRTADSLRKTALVAQIRFRLANGDFSQGDRIVLAVLNAPPPISPLPDTLTVSESKTLSFPRFAGLADLSLVGVLRSELAERVTAHLARELIRPAVRVTSLIRVAVFGAVVRPNYYTVPPEAQLDELITSAGGYTAESDPAKVTVQRGTVTILPAPEVRHAIAAGLSVDRLHLMAGDEVIVGRRVQRSWLTVLQVGLGFVSLLVLTYTSLRRR